MVCAVDVDSREVLAFEAVYGRGSLNTLTLFQKALKLCINKPKIMVDRVPWYNWTLERLGLRCKRSNRTVS